MLKKLCWMSVLKMAVEKLPPSAAARAAPPRPRRALCKKPRRREGIWLHSPCARVECCEEGISLYPQVHTFAGLIVHLSHPLHTCMQNQWQATSGKILQKGKTLWFILSDMSWPVVTFVDHANDLTWWEESSNYNSDFSNTVFSLQGPGPRFYPVVSWDFRGFWW